MSEPGLGYDPSPCAALVAATGEPCGARPSSPWLARELEPGVWLCGKHSGRYGKRATLSDGRPAPLWNEPWPLPDEFIRRNRRCPTCGKNGYAG